MTMPMGPDIVDQITRQIVLTYGNAEERFTATTLLGRARAEILRGPRRTR